MRIGWLAAVLDRNRNGWLSGHVKVGVRLMQAFESDG